MQRRKFLEHFSLFALGASLAPTVLFSCRNKHFFDNAKFNGKVVIIGAGVAGLYAGYILKSKGAEVVILEASAQYGGRLGIHTGFADYHLDTGAYRIYGRNTIIFDLITKNNIAIRNIDSDVESINFWFNGQVVNGVPMDIYMFRQRNLPDVSYKEYAIQKGFDSSYEYIVESVAAENGASASRISTYWNWKEKSNTATGANIYKPQSSYFEIIEETVAKHVKNNILYNHAVNAIDYSGQDIKVYTTNNNVFSCDKLIIAVPITVLKSNTIQFTPALPAEKIQAFNKIGMDAGMKVFLKFQTNFYRKNLYGGKTCTLYIDDAAGKNTNQHVLQAIAVGEQAQQLTNLGNDTAIINAIIQELDTMYGGQASANFISGVVFNYTTNPFIQGLYSYSTVQMGDARQIAAKNVQNKLFFAGEAMNISSHHGSVHGAVESAYQSVIQLFQSVKS